MRRKSAAFIAHCRGTVREMNNAYEKFDCDVLQCCHYFAIKILRAFDAVPGTLFIFERKDARIVGVEHDPDISLDVGVLPAVPVFGMNVRVSIRRQILRAHETEDIHVPNCRNPERLRRKDYSLLR